MRIVIVFVFTAMLVALIICAGAAHRSGKEIGVPLRNMLIALLPPIAGNLIITASTEQMSATAGYYIYFIGMDMVAVALIQFTLSYCSIEPKKWMELAVSVPVLADVLQIMSNPFLGATFATEQIEVYGSPYYRLIPYLGQTFHRVVVYAIVFAALLTFIHKARISNRFYSEKYIVIIAVMVITTAWETLYIFSRTPLDRSMLGFGTFGLLVFYFSLYYRPFRLLDRMLSEVASNIPDALFFFDNNSKCIWVNKRGMEITGAGSGDYDEAAARFRDIIGDLDESEEDWSEQKTAGSGDSEKSYVIEHRMVNDGKGHDIGYFLNVRDNTREQKTLQQEIYNATHDALTQLYNRAGYDLLVKSMKQDTVMMLIVDVDEFKSVNDKHGHHIGDLILQKIARTLVDSFRSNDYVCRVGGDEFVILMARADMSHYDNIERRVKNINRILGDSSDGLPAVSVSVGVAYGGKDVDVSDLFDRADQALYDTKREGKNGISVYQKKDPAEVGRDAGKLS